MFKIGKEPSGKYFQHSLSGPLEYNIAIDVRTVGRATIYLDL